MYKSFFKRAFDIVFAIGVLVGLLPLYIGTWLILLVLNNGKAFFTQNRVGKDNRIFRLLKFRSMNDKRGPDGVLLKDVERLTKFGLFIRKASLDELPQIFNVLKGDMSIVGPRPLLPEYLPYYNTHHARRHEVRPGVTGLAQVMGRNNLKFSQRFDLDVKYVDTISFAGDISILWQTFTGLFKRGEIRIGRPMSEVDDIGITRGLSSHYFNTDDKRP